MVYLNYMLSELRRRKGRTLLTALGLGVGVAVVITVSALSAGLDRAQAKVLQPLVGVGTDMSVTRPIVAMSIKAFVPIGLIVVCAALVFFVRPRYVEGRIGLGITALLTLVALQLTSGASLPDVDYLMMIDKIYLLAYLFIILALARVVMTSWRGADAEAEASISRADRIWVGLLLVAYFAANLAVAWSALRVA